MTVCCGATGSGLLGGGNVHCEVEEGAAVGLCRNPDGLQSSGQRLHYQDYACRISSARNNCCAGVGNSGVCQLDSLGVPRCDGLDDQCRAAGETCSSATDCCNDLPCVPGFVQRDAEAFIDPSGQSAKGAARIRSSTVGTAKPSMWRRPTSAHGCKA